MAANNKAIYTNSSSPCIHSLCTYIIINIGEIITHAIAIAIGARHKPIKNFLINCFVIICH